MQATRPQWEFDPALPRSVLCLLGIIETMNQTAGNEDALLKALREAAANHAEPDRVEEMVGLPALLNTRREPGREALKIADIAPDPDFQTSVPDLKGATDVVYWDHGWTRAAVRIAGLVWHHDGRIEVFCGMIYPP